MEELIIIGNGNMAQALCAGLGEKYRLHVFGRNSIKLEEFKNKLDFVEISTFSEPLDISGKKVILCVKPNSLDDVATKLIGEADILISILAGSDISKISSKIKAKSIVRAMPNVGAKFLKSMTTLTGDVASKDFACELFLSIGSVLWVDTQKELDIATAVAGSGPAYLALVADAMIDGAVKLGLSRANATNLTAGLFDGFAPLVKEFEPSQIKNNVMSPGGTTAAGIAYLEQNATRSSFMGCVESAYKKAVELSK